MCGSCGGRGKIVETEKQKQDFGYKHAQVERRCLDCKETGKRFKIYFKSIGSAYRIPSTS
jgi:DnaJ-class molecular chaperone